MRSPGLTHSQIERYWTSLGVFGRMALVLMILLSLLLFGIPTAFAQTEPAITFGADVTSANGTLNTRLTWSTTPAAQSCVASGHASWTGAKQASGSADLPAISVSGTYNLTLACTWPGDTTARLSWVAPIANTDGSTLARCASQTETGPCLSSFTVYHGLTAAALTDPVDIADRNATTYSWTGLAAGTHFFAVRAFNGSGVQSGLSNVASKVITATQTKNDAVTLTVNPLPNTPSGFTVE